VAAEISTIVMKFDKKKWKEQANIPLGLTHHIINMCGGTKTTPLNYITLKHANGRARLTTRFLYEYCGHEILSMVTTWRFDGWGSRRLTTAS